MSILIYFEQNSRHHLHDLWDLALVNILSVIQAGLINYLPEKTQGGYIALLTRSTYGWP